jgi:glucokinase
MIMSLSVGLDIGGTKLLVASADERGQIIQRAVEPTPLDLDDGIAVLHQMIAAVSGGQKITAMGAAVGGPLDWRQGIVSPLHQPEWRKVPLKAIMQERWQCPFFVDVDTNVAALGEYHFGGEKASRFLYLTISTGMGGGFLLDGRLYRGVGEQHPEVAHQSIHYRCSHPGGIQCECGVPDCLEALVSGNGIRRIYGKPAELLNEDEWGEVSYNLGQGLRNLATIYCPEVVVLGGGVAMGRGEPLVTASSEVMAAHLRLVAVPHVRLSRLGSDTALMGAIAIAQNSLRETV